MADSAVFEFVCDRLETLSGLAQLAARGTVRIVLRESGLDAKHVTRDQMAVVVDKILTGELGSRGVDDADGISVMLLTELKTFEGEGPATDSPESFVARTRASRD